MAMTLLDRIRTFSPFGDGAPLDRVPRSRSPEHEGEERIVCFFPSTVDDAAEIGERLKEDQAVVVNLEKAGTEDRKRIVDFLSGVIFAIEGDGRKVADHIFVFAPEGIVLEFPDIASSRTSYAHPYVPLQARVAGATY